MRVPSSHSRTAQRIEPVMTPMIDVVFLLLIFFVWTASFQAIESILPSQLTSVVSVGTGADLQEEDFERIVVRLDRVGEKIRWEINQQQVASLADLGKRLGQLAAIRADLTVVIDPTTEVPFGDVIDVYDAALRIGLSNIQFTTREELLTS